ncbi:beta/gamma crystallin family protein [Massilia agri]|uniref:Beta/gamma crystallin family protein n=1 Tax=Massilia agri TaxID=1886785 RepID=A0ABT2AIK0_9BURK|nr:beta/gamma crystallin family protein [Massilia agri]MCS0595996.1 beta/gamma crystallin family protein [Massilia agri]
MKPLLAALALLASINHAAAGEISLFTDADYRGRPLTLREPVMNLDRIGFNDRASSAIVRSGTWEICEHKDFGGRCIVLGPGEYRMFDGFNDQASSVRELERGRGRDGYRDRDRRHDDGGWGRRGPPVELFADRRFGGEGIMLASDVHSLRSRNFNDRAGSMIVREGEWQVCEHDDYRGRCVVYGPGRHPLPRGLDGMVSSVRRVR